MNTNSSAIDRVPQQPIVTGKLMPSQPIGLHNPGSWLKTGYSPAEIILASAVLVSAIAILLSSIATLIHGDSHAEIILAVASLVSAIASLISVFKPSKSR
jgi:hypothetical protein